MIEFKKIKIQNFLSILNPITFDFTTKKITIIRGDNGTGKSALFLDSISFVLFGKAYRKIQKSALCNINSKKTLIELWLSIDNVDFYIKRGLNPSVFQIYKNDVLIDSHNQIEYQNYLEKIILKISYLSFCQIVLLGKTNYSSFFKLSLPIRRAFIEEIFGLKIFSRMNDVIREKYQTIKERKINFDNKEEKINLKFQMIKENKDKRDTLQQNIEKSSLILKELEKDCVSYFDKIKNYKDKLSLIETRIIFLEKSIFSLEKQSVCICCNRIISNNEEIIEKNKNELEILKRKQRRIKFCITTYETCQNFYLKRQAEIENCKNTINSNNYILDEFLSNDDNIDDELIKIQDEKKSCNNELRNVEYLQSVFRDTGVKKYIINNYFTIITNIFNTYIKNVGLNCRLEFDEDFNEKFYLNDKIFFNYDSFSEGEKVRIDFVMTLTWRELCQLKHKLNINLMVFDELFDSSLDNVGHYYLLKTLDDLFKKNKIILITHKNTWYDSSNNFEIINVTKDTFTKIEHIR